MDFNTPSIHELYNSAKKLLTLQTRVENRQIRKSSQVVQKNKLFSDGGHDLANIMDNYTNLDALSPISFDDIKNSPPLTEKRVDKRISNPNIAGNAVAGFSSITPVSLDDSPLNISSNTDLEGDSMWSHGSEFVSPIEQPRSQSNLSAQIRRSEQGTTSPLTMMSPAITNISENAENAMHSSSLPLNAFKKRFSNALGASLPTTGQSPVNGITECSNCRTIKTPLWRKDPMGNTLCNACGLFQKLHGTMRPLSLKTDVIKKRNSRRVSINEKKFIRRNSEDQFNYLSNSTSNSNSGVSIGSARYKNVLILPKPMGAGSSTASTPATPLATTPQATPPNINIPNRGFYVNSNHSSGVSLSNTPVESSGSQFKRQKSETSFEYLPINTNQYNDNKNKRIPNFNSRAISLSNISSSLNKNLMRSNSSSYMLNNFAPKGSPSPSSATSSPSLPSPTIWKESAPLNEELGESSGNVNVQDLDWLKFDL